MRMHVCIFLCLCVCLVFTVCSRLCMLIGVGVCTGGCTCLQGVWVREYIWGDQVWVYGHVCVGIQLFVHV